MASPVHILFQRDIYLCHKQVPLPKVNTIDDVKWETGVRFAEHDRHLKIPLLEFTGNGAYCASKFHFPPFSFFVIVISG